MQDLELNPNLFVAAMTQSPFFHTMLNSQAHLLAQQIAATAGNNVTTTAAVPTNTLSSTTSSNAPAHHTAQGSTSNHSPPQHQGNNQRPANTTHPVSNAYHSQQSAPFSNTLTSLLGFSTQSPQQLTVQSPYVSTKMDIKLRKSLIDKLGELHTKIKGCTKAEYIENNRDFLMAYDDIIKFIHYAGFQSMVNDPTETYNFDDADVMEVMIRTIFSATDATSIIIQGKNATLSSQPTPNTIPHPYYLWQAITEYFTITHRLFEELRNELNTLQWNGPEGIRDMRDLHSYVMIRVHLFQTTIATQHFNTAMDNDQLFYALDKMLRDNMSPYKATWSEEYRKIINAPSNVQMEKLLAFIRDNKTMESQLKSNARRPIATKVQTLVATSSSQHDPDHPFNLASSGGTTLSNECDQYLMSSNRQSTRRR